MKNRNIIFLGIVSFVVTLFVLSLINQSSNTGSVAEVPDTYSLAWKSMYLKNLQDEEVFTISDLDDKPVLLESFAVWCPSCTRQQKEIEELKEGEFSDMFYSVAMNTDANEDEQIVRDHIAKNGFSGRYVIADAMVTQALVDDFSFAILNAPSMPVVLLCQNGKGVFFLESGLKSSGTLRDHIVSKCGV